jgi:hypothetical protein
MDYEMLIKQHLPQDLRDVAKQYTIPGQFLETMPELMTLVLRSRSMDKPEEKQSWFNLLPMMNQDQINKLSDILVRERDKLAEIEKKYEEKKLEIKKKYLLRRQNMGYIKKVNEIKQQEAVHAQQDTQEADSLLSQI